MANAQYTHYRQFLRGINQFTRLMRCDCINGYALGYKRVSNKNSKQVSVIVFVNKKLPQKRLPLANRIPETFRVPYDKDPSGVLEFVTDIQEARFSALEYTAKQRPAPSGISIGHIDISAGTLGGLVRDRETENIVILSNNHVIANSNEGIVGDTIIQPGTHDGGQSPQDDIATLTRFVPINFESGAENRVDGAIATPINVDDVLWSTLDIGPETPQKVRTLGESDLGVYVHKTGRTTEHTQGFVQALFATVQVKYELFQKATFVDQIIISQNPSEEDFSNGGDSGSLVYDSQNSCVGLLFAGSSGSDQEPATTIANPIRTVFRELNIECLNPGDHPSDAPAEGQKK